MPPDPAPPPFPRPGAGLSLEPGPDRPLGGLVLLAVEDSRFASDALRLCAQRLGARLRRAETLAAAQAHLARYRPDAVLVDEDLPDGRGSALVADVAARPVRPALVGHSGDDAARAVLLAAGADGFLPKPIPSLAALRDAVLAALPGRGWHGDAADSGALPRADPLALRDDLRHAADLLALGSPAASPFVAMLARAARDRRLWAAAQGTPDALARAVALRLARIEAAHPVTP
jgi:DNA-binding response OmpR family regulator